MYYIKLLIIVIAGSIGTWYAVQELVLSTDHMADSYTINNYKQTTDDESTVLPQLDQAESEQDDAHEELKVESIEEIIVRAEQLPDSRAVDQPLPAELELVVEEDPNLEIFAKSDTKIDKNKQKSDKQSGDREPSEKVRSDSDADMQASSDNIAESKIEINSQIKALELDKNLLGTINSNETIKEKVKPKTVRALDLAYAEPRDSNCVIPGDDYPRVGVHYRPSSFAIKGKSLSDIDKLVALYKKCGGKLLIQVNKTETNDADERLNQMRQDEIKYYLLQQRIPKGDMVFPGDL